MADQILPLSSGIYSITNKINGKRYIGSATNLRYRWKCHKSRLKLQQHHSPKLQNAYNKHGADNFVFEIIEHVNDVNILIKREQFWLDFYNPFKDVGYNICPVAGNCYGTKQSEKTKELRRQKMIGRIVPPEVGRKISESKLSKSKEEKAIYAKNLSEALKARTPEAKAESAARAVETKRKNGTLKSKPEAVEKQRMALKGRKVSADVIARRSETVRADALRRRENGEVRKYVRRKLPNEQQGAANEQNIPTN